MAERPLKFFTPIGAMDVVNEEDEDLKLQQEFMYKLKKLDSYFDPTYESWTGNKIDAFKQVLGNALRIRLTDAKILFEYRHNKQREVQLMITVKSDEYGELSTMLEVKMLLHKECPINLPTLVAQEFAKELKKSR